jgi:dephospho-CoA kinase
MMLIVGLTGSIGMGKSTAAARFAANGIAVFDADAKVHELYNGPLALKIEAAFPGTTEHRKVDRAKLSAALLKEPEKFKQLEAIVHPAVREAERAFVRHEAAGGAKIAVLEIPLLLESDGAKTVDAVIVVSASADVQRARVLARSGMTPEKLDRLLLRQMPDAEKRSKADYVVDTGGSVEACNAQVDAIIAKLSHKTGDAYKRFWA